MWSGGGRLITVIIIVSIDVAFVVPIVIIVLLDHLTAIITNHTPLPINTINRRRVVIVIVIPRRLVGLVGIRGIRDTTVK